MSDSQKFLSRNRAPRVQIEYDVELYGAEKKVQLPFVMGVLSDLSGKSERPPVADRKFLEIDVDNFDDRMKAVAPRAQFTVPNTLTGEGAVAIDLTFEKMSDFSPEAIASRVDSLAPLLAARRQLSDLMAYMDGKSGAETLIETLLSSRGLLQAVAGGAEEAGYMDAALASLRQALPEEPQEDRSRDAALAALAAMQPTDEEPDPSVADILGTVERRETPEEGDSHAAALDALRQAQSDEPEAPADDMGVLIDLASRAPQDQEPENEADRILEEVERRVEVDEQDNIENILGALDAPEEAPDEDWDALLSEIEAVEDALEEMTAETVFAAVERAVAHEIEDPTNAILASLDSAPEAADARPDEDAALASVPRLEIVRPDEDIDDVLSGMGCPEPDEEEDLDALQNDLETPEQPADTAPDNLDALLADMDESVPSSAIADETLFIAEPDADAARDDGDTMGGDLDALLGALDEDASEPSDDPVAGQDAPEVLDDLDALAAALDGDEDGDFFPAGEAAEADAAPAEDLDPDLDALLADLDDDAPAADAEAVDPDASLTGLGDTLDETMDAKAETVAAPPKPQSPFGWISAPRPDRRALNRTKFRMVLLGDFTGRASRGVREIGAALAARPPILLDVDTIDEVIEGFATTLVLPIGKDGGGIEVKLTELDDLHPDELYDSLPIFGELAGLRQQLQLGSMADKARQTLQGWADAYSLPIRLPRSSASTSVPANLKLSDFQALIGDTGGTLGRSRPLDDLVARIVGPHVVKAPDAGTDAMLAAVDQALSSAMRLVLHHPDFQAVEVQWRSLDLLARRVASDSTLEIVLYDVSAEELAMDLAAQEDLADSGLFRLLTDVLDPEEGAGGFSAIFGLYTFEETPPHAELLARIGQVARHVDAPFFTAMTSAFLDVAQEDRHPLVAKTWDKLRATPEAAYLGLVAPRMLLRLPYGARTEPCDAFDFEEFTAREGLSGMLWANPAVLVAILLAATYKKDGKAMVPGSVMSLGDMPFHYVTDRYGDQVALPCTERNLTEKPVQHALARGYMPVVGMRGRNEVRLASFRALGGAPIAGRWSDAEPEARAPGKETDAHLTLVPETALEDDASGIAASFAETNDTDAGDGDGGGNVDLDALLSDLGSGDDAETKSDAGDDDDLDLDALLASFGSDDETATTDDDEMDPELAALLEGLG